VIIIDESGAAPVVKFPVALAVGSTLQSFTDNTGTTFINNTLVIPTGSANSKSGVLLTIKDEHGDLNTTLTIKTGDAVGTGKNAVADVKSMEGAHSTFSERDLTPEEEQANVPQPDRVGTVATAISVYLNTVPQNAKIEIATSREPDATATSAFQMVASDIGMSSYEIAYSVKVTRVNLGNGTDIRNAYITMKAGKDWVDTHGGNDVIKIFRFDLKTGQHQALQTQFEGYDSDGLAIFRGFSPNGLSIFALVGLPRATGPSVVSILPRDHTLNVGTNSAISVTFNKEMDKASSQSAFSIWPATSGKFNWDGNTLMFTPDAVLNSDTSYTVTVTTNAMDLAGNTLAGTAISMFKTGINPDTVSPNVIETSPTDGSSSISVNAAITVYFDEPMNETAVEKGFIISPSARGAFRWHDNSVTFTPENILDFDTQYSVTITNNATDLAGNPLASEFHLAFRTMPPPVLMPVVLSTSILSGDTDVKINGAFSVTFSQAMDRDSAEKAFSISPAMSGKFIWADDFTIKFIPDTDLQSATIYTVTISNTARDMAGNNLYATYTCIFTTAKASSSTTVPRILGLVAVGIAGLVLLIVLFARRKRKDSPES